MRWLVLSTVRGVYEQYSIVKNLCDDCIAELVIIASNRWISFSWSCWYRVEQTKVLCRKDRERTEVLFYLCVGELFRVVLEPDSVPCQSSTVCRWRRRTRGSLCVSLRTWTRTDPGPACPENKTRNSANSVQPIGRSPVADLRGRGRASLASRCPNSFIFMQFSAKKIG